MCLCVLHADVPGVPFDLHVTFETDDTIIGLAWQPPNYHMTSQFVLAPLDNYLVEARQVGKIPFTTLMKVDGAVTNTTIAPLYPGTTYDVRVVAANMAGGTPSESINITTNASGMSANKLAHTHTCTHTHTHTHTHSS